MVAYREGIFGFRKFGTFIALARNPISDQKSNVHSSSVLDFVVGLMIVIDKNKHKLSRFERQCLCIIATLFRLRTPVLIVQSLGDTYSN